MLQSYSVFSDPSGILGHQEPDGSSYAFPILYPVSFPYLDVVKTRQAFRVETLLCPELFAAYKNVELNPKLEKEIVLKHVDSHLSARDGSVHCPERTEVLNLRQISIDLGDDRKVSRDWLYVVVTPDALFIVAAAKTPLLQEIDRQIALDKTDLPSTCTLAAASNILRIVHDSTANALYHLIHRTRALTRDANLPTTVRKEHISELSDTFSYLVRRVPDESVAAQQVRALMAKCSLSIFGIEAEERDRIDLTISTLQDQIHKHTGDVKETTSGMDRVLNVLNLEEQQADAKAQKGTERLSLMFAILGGLSAPPMIAWQICQAYQLSGEARDMATVFGLVGGAALGVALVPFNRLLKRLMNGNNRNTVSRPNAHRVVEEPVEPK